jgi:hypothetical protein
VTARGPFEHPYACGHIFLDTVAGGHSNIVDALRSSAHEPAEILDIIEWLAGDESHEIDAGLAAMSRWRSVIGNRVSRFRPALPKVPYDA